MHMTILGFQMQYGNHADRNPEIISSILGGMIRGLLQGLYGITMLKMYCSCALEFRNTEMICYQHIQLKGTFFALGSAT